MDERDLHDLMARTSDPVGEVPPPDPGLIRRRAGELAQRQHRRRLVSVAASVAAVVLVAAVPVLLVLREASPPPPPASPTLPSLPIGVWKVADAAGEEPDAVVRLGGLEFDVARRCGTIGGSWNADTSGVFVALVFQADSGCSQRSTVPEAAWLTAAQRLRPSGSGWELLDAGGIVTARLLPGGQAPTARIAERWQLLSERDPDSEVSAWITREPAPVPPGLTAARLDQVIGEWHPARGPFDPGTDRRLTINANGEWVARYGCQGSGGTLRLGDDGHVVGVQGPQADSLCISPGEKADVNAALASFDIARAGRLALDPEGRLVALDDHGARIATFEQVRAELVRGPSNAQ